MNIRIRYSNPLGEYTECNLAGYPVTEGAGFISRAGLDIHVEGPFVYLANERGLDILDLR